MTKLRIWTIAAVLAVAAQGAAAQSYMGSPLSWSSGSDYLATVAADNFIRIYRVAR